MEFRELRGRTRMLLEDWVRCALRGARRSEREGKNHTLVSSGVGLVDSEKAKNAFVVLACLHI